MQKRYPGRTGVVIDNISVLKLSRATSILALSLLLIRITFLFVIGALVGCTYFSHSSAPFAGKIGTDSPIAYHCKSGHTVDASYHSSTTAIVRYEGRAREMIVAISGSGARYVGGGLEWWTKGVGQGSQGTLFRHEDDGTTGEIIEMCVQVTSIGFQD
ncbi:MliC family protein [Nitrosospira briensis]|uniref:MliC family protein n=1 Tax=Nitrosospira briensis TaxID=35799 RepID=UPI00046991C5|nr:MliC family protein [Nitrosospira briensis]